MPQLVTPPEIHAARQSIRTAKEPFKAAMDILYSPNLQLPALLTTLNRLYAVTRLLNLAQSEIENLILTSFQSTTTPPDIGGEDTSSVGVYAKGLAEIADAQEGGRSAAQVAVEPQSKLSEQETIDDAKS